MQKTKICILIILVTAIISGCSLNKNNNDTQNDKIKEEIMFHENKILAIFNSLNAIFEDNYNIVSSEKQITQSNSKNNSSQNQENSSKNSSNETNSANSQNNDKETISITEFIPQTILESEKKINWRYLKNEIEIINSAWNITITDLYNANVPNNKIIEYSNILNECTLNIKNEDKIKTEANLILLYNLLIEYSSQNGEDRNQIKIKESRSSVIACINNINNNNWDDASYSIQSAITKIEEIMKDYEYMKNKQNEINKIYIAINEIYLSLANKDRDIVLIKYKNLNNMYKMCI